MNDGVPAADTVHLYCPCTSDTDFVIACAGGDDCRTAAGVFDGVILAAGGDVPGFLAFSKDLHFLDLVFLRLILQGVIIADGDGGDSFVFGVGGLAVPVQQHATGN